eukprot:397634-Pleurochrysis_carterae.AAC.1
MRHARCWPPPPSCASRLDTCPARAHAISAPKLARNSASAASSARPACARARRCSCARSPRTTLHIARHCCRHWRSKGCSRPRATLSTLTTLSSTRFRRLQRCRSWIQGYLYPACCRYQSYSDDGRRARLGAAPVRQCSEH